MASPIYWACLLIVALVHWLLPARLRRGWLAATFIGFLAWQRPAETGAFVAGSVLVYLGLKDAADPKNKTAAITLIAALALILGVWKSVPTAVVGLTFVETAAAGLAPVGLSYLVFKLIHVVAEIRRGTLTRPGFVDFTAYLFFLPMFTAGPIERFDRFQATQEPSWHRGLLLDAAHRILLGLVKKFALSEGLFYMLEGRLSLGRHHEWDWTHEGSTPVAWAYVAAAYFRIYLDFSAYTDLAIGSGRLFGVRLMENFNWPVLASSPSDFWRRWHISLSSWCQNYIYMPTLGLFRSPYVPTVLVFLVMGGWHIVSWNRVGWALYNAAGVLGFMVWTRVMGRIKPGHWRSTPAWKIASVAMTQVFVLGSIAFFMNGEDQTLTYSLTILKRMLGIPAGPSEI